MAEPACLLVARFEAKGVVIVVRPVGPRFLIRCRANRSAAGGEDAARIGAGLR